MRLLPSNPVTLHIADPAEIKRDWGPIKEGVRANLSVDKLIYPVGEDVPLHIAVENASATQPVYDEPFRPRPAFSGSGYSTIEIKVEDEDGPLTPQMKQFDASSGGPLTCPAPFLPGKPVYLEKSLHRSGFLPSKPGTYKVTVTWSPFTQDIQDCDAVLHPSPSKPIVAPPSAKPFVSVTSNPVMLHIEGDSSSAQEPEYTAWKEHFSLTDTSFGDKTALLDKETHLEWLRLSITVGFSYDEVRAQMGTDGKLAGWRFATVDELRVFFANFTGYSTGHLSDAIVERKLQRLLGGPLSEYSNPATGWYRRDSYGYVGDPVGPDKNMIRYHAGYIAEGSDGVTIDPDSGGSCIPGFASSSWGSFLVRHQ